MPGAPVEAAKLQISLSDIRFSQRTFGENGSESFRDHPADPSRLRDVPVIETNRVRIARSRSRALARNMRLSDCGTPSLTHKTASVGRKRVKTVLAVDDVYIIIHGIVTAGPKVSGVAHFSECGAVSIDHAFIDNDR